MTAVHHRSHREVANPPAEEKVTHAKAKENYELFCKGLGSTLFAGKPLNDKKILELMEKCPDEITNLFRAVAKLPKSKQAKLWGVTDIHITKKIQETQKKLHQMTGSHYHGESARATASMLTALVTHYLERAPELADELRPAWMEYLITEENKKCVYSPIGEKVSHFTKNHKKLITEVLHLNFLRATTQLVVRLEVLHKKNPFALLDLVKDMHIKAKVHFDGCRSGNIEEKKKKAEAYFLQTLTTSLEKTFFPEGGKNLELPFSPVVRKHMDDYILGVLKKEVMPHLSKSLFDLLRSEYMKTSMLFEMMSFIHKAVDDEAPLELEKETEITYPCFGELVEAIEGSITSVLTYFDPSFLKWLEGKVTPQKLAHAFATQICIKFQSVTFLEMQKKAIHRALPQLVSGGKWEQSGEFVLPDISFNTTQDELQAKQAARAKETKEKEAKLSEITGKIGRKCDGLKAIIHKFLFGEKKQETGSRSIIGSIGSAVSNVGKNIAVNIGSTLTGAPSRIQKLSVAILEKVRLPEHEPMLYELAQIMVALPGLGAY
jgi:hypothetical protein